VARESGAPPCKQRGTLDRRGRRQAQAAGRRAAHGRERRGRAGRRSLAPRRASAGVPSSLACRASSQACQASPRPWPSCRACQACPPCHRHPCSSLCPCCWPCCRPCCWPFSPWLGPPLSQARRAPWRPARGAARAVCRREARALRMMLFPCEATRLSNSTLCDLPGKPACRDSYGRTSLRPDHFCCWSAACTELPCAGRSIRGFLSILCRLAMGQCCTHCCTHRLHITPTSLQFVGPCHVPSSFTTSLVRQLS